MLLDTIYTYPQDYPCRYVETLAFKHPSELLRLLHNTLFCQKVAIVFFV